jgi:hypothetical protein
VNRVWTEEELEILRSDRAAKVPVPVTAAKLGRPVPATYARARLIGTLVQAHQPWDENSTSRLRQLVLTDPPITDKRIAEELGRTVTQIRWKLHDLGLIGVRDLSKLAKSVGAGGSHLKPKSAIGARPSKSKATSPSSEPSSEQTARHVRTTAPPPASPAPSDISTALKQALELLESELAKRLKQSVAESEASMVQAATEAISEKRGIDQRIAELGKRAAESVSRVEQRNAAAKAEDAVAASGRDVEDAKPPRKDRRLTLDKPKGSSSKTVGKKSILPSVQGSSQPPATRYDAQSAPASTPKIVVVEAPAAPRPTPDVVPAPAQVSGRGGWKSVRRDPTRVMAQAKAKSKAANRGDAVDLAQAAQSAIERFIAERGVTKKETNVIEALVSRLQARGYIVVQNGEGWIIDQRHHVDGKAALTFFAEARGISLDAAA